MSFKVYMLDPNLDQFMENMGAYSEELGKRFHRNILDFERRYTQDSLVDYIRKLIYENDLRVLSEI